MINPVSIKDVKLKVAELIKLLRKRRNISQEQLARQLGLSRYTITNIESGQNATLDTLLKILHHFELLEDFESFIGGEIRNNGYDSLY